MKRQLNRAEDLKTSNSTSVNMTLAAAASSTVTVTAPSPFQMAVKEWGMQAMEWIAVQADRVAALRVAGGPVVVGIMATIGSQQGENDSESKKQMDAGNSSPLSGTASPPPPDDDDGDNKYKETKSGQSGKDAAKDVPSWAKGQRPTVKENGKQFAKRLLDQKYGSGNYPKGPARSLIKYKNGGIGVLRTIEQGALMENVYLVQHVRELSDGTEDVKIVGIFMNELDAQKMINSLKTKKGFSSCVEGFSVDKYQLNKGFWQEGFEL